jgi:hypothetical protein
MLLISAGLFWPCISSYPIVLQMSTSANRQWSRQVEVVEYIYMKSELITNEIRKTTASGPTGELILPCRLVPYCRTKNPTIMLTIETLSLPSKLKIPPSPAVKVNVIECFKISKKPLIAAVQKFSPVSATWQ